MQTLTLETKEKEKLKRLAGSERKSLQWVGYTVNLETCQVRDKLNKDSLVNEATIRVLNILLSHYSKARPRQKSGKLVRFGDLPGGHAYEVAFTQRVNEPIAKVFGAKSWALIEAAKILNGVALNYGDSSVEIPALLYIPIVYILWESSELPASATTFFDETARHYLPTEDLAVLAELTTIRLEAAWTLLQESKRKR